MLLPQFFVAPKALYIIYGSDMVKINTKTYALLDTKLNISYFEMK